MPQKKLRITMKAFVTISILLIWLIHSRQIYQNKLHEKALRIAYKVHFSSFEEFLCNSKSVIVHQRNLQILAEKKLSGLCYFFMLT